MVKVNKHTKQRLNKQTKRKTMTKEEAKQTETLNIRRAERIIERILRRK